MRNKIAIVYDWFDSWGGAERVISVFAEMFPDADWYTSYLDEKKAFWAKDLKLQASFIQHLPFFIKDNRVLSTPLYPFAFESFDFSGYDLVITITSSFAKGVITRPPTKHLCYLLTPTRFLWSHGREYKTDSFFLRPYTNYLKKWDKIAFQRPDQYICISETVQKRLQLLLDRAGVVIYPPFDIEYWEVIKKAMNRHPERFDRSQRRLREGSYRDSLSANWRTQNDEILNTSYSILNTKYFLIVSRLEPYKKVNLVVETFKHLPEQNLIIIGSGSQLDKLKQNASKNITFLQNLTDEELAAYYSNAQALIMPQEEDFGLSALEAQFFGCPVIAYKKGGATETVIAGKTGIFFNEQSLDSLRDSIAKFGKMSYTLKKSTQKEGPRLAERFSRHEFEKKFMTYLRSVYQFNNDLK